MSLPSSSGTLNFDCCATRKDGPVSFHASSEKDVRQWGYTATTLTAVELRPRCSYDDATAVPTALASYTRQPQHDDIEQISAREHMVLSVYGMTCTGCSKNFMNVLSRTPGVSSPQVKFVSGSAEFDVDTFLTGEVNAALSRIEKETGFKCSRIVNEYQEMCVLMSASSAECLENSNIAGLVSVTKGKDQTYRISFNSRIVGARSLLLPDARLESPEKNAVSTDENRRLTWAALNTALAASLTIPVVVLEWSNNPVPYTGLAVPMVLVIAGGVAARAGLFTKAADAIERASQVTDVVFDETGTLTETDLKVDHETLLPIDTLRKEDILSLCESIVDGNQHPVSAAVGSRLASQPLPADKNV
ncbi:hypothetical protein LTR10_010192 [Elasticomyces elasticus]|nr:hypothetical protein LTR10_010192 [Elasticomyces elasticus]KAK4972096.1 hypothetical protein LTR42_006602 [Elasticomyces elasticus]